MNAGGVIVYCKSLLGAKNECGMDNFFLTTNDHMQVVFNYKCGLDNFFCNYKSLTFLHLKDDNT